MKCIFGVSLIVALALGSVEAEKYPRSKCAEYNINEILKLRHQVRHLETFNNEKNNNDRQLSMTILNLKRESLLKIEKRSLIQNVILKKINKIKKEFERLRKQTKDGKNNAETLKSLIILKGKKVEQIAAERGQDCIANLLLNLNVNVSVAPPTTTTSTTTTTPATTTTSTTTTTTTTAPPPTTPTTEPTEETTPISPSTEYPEETTPNSGTSSSPSPHSITIIQGLSIECIVNGIPSNISGTVDLSTSCHCGKLTINFRTNIDKFTLHGPASFGSLLENGIVSRQASNINELRTITLPFFFTDAETVHLKLNDKDIKISHDDINKDL
ncbi:unnamed protein product [Caenorhabditis angaria]|uniref:Uncharacterized protein n=1 Tax=Caenorhabditis angaria TaxID=860376 RepID=A0A9P1N4Z2_9PELO|nr:unnamed protein product [Caenorhabditis angaria]